MDTDGRSIELEEIENLLQWQYSHLAELDDYMLTHAQSYKSIFLDPHLSFDRTFISQTILRLNLFRNGIGKGLIIKNKPINEFLDEIEVNKGWLVSFKKKYKKKIDSTICESVKNIYMVLHIGQLTHVLVSTTNLIIDRELAYVQYLEYNQARQAVRKRLFEIGSERIKFAPTCKIRIKYWEKEQGLYELLDNHLIANKAVTLTPSQTDIDRSRIVQTHITNNGDGNILNTGSNVSIIATIHQLKSNQDKE